MKTLSKILIGVSVLLVIIIGFLWYMNFFSTLNATEKTEGGYTVAGLDVIGPYSESGRYMREANNKLKALGINSTKGVGIYYDDPKITPKEKCRSLVGNIIEEKNLRKLNNLPANGLKIDLIPKKPAVVVEFPLKNMMSYMLGPMKVYPVISKLMSRKKYESVLSFEIYDNTENKITYVMQYK